MGQAPDGIREPERARRAAQAQRLGLAAARVDVVRRVALHQPLLLDVRSALRVKRRGRLQFALLRRHEFFCAILHEHAATLQLHSMVSERSAAQTSQACDQLVRDRLRLVGRGPRPLEIHHFFPTLSCGGRSGGGSERFLKEDGSGPPPARAVGRARRVWLSLSELN